MDKNKIYYFMFGFITGFLLISVLAFQVFINNTIQTILSVALLIYAIVYFIISFVLSVYVYRDSKGYKTNSIGWAIAVFIFPLTIIIYLIIKSIE